MKNIFKIFHELNNGEKLKNILPYNVFYDMCHEFAEQKISTNTLTVNDAKNKKTVIQQHIGNSTFKRKIEAQPFVKMLFDRDKYPEELPQNQVLLHGIMYNALYNTYLSYLRKFSDDKGIHISLSDYEKMPKRYRGIFIRRNENDYVMNISTKDMLFAFNKKNRQKIENLLSRARQLIPVIYKENKNYDISDEELVETYNKIYTKTNFSGPNFVPESSSAKRVSDEQMKTIQELHDIFVELSKITLPVVPQTNPLKTTTAQDIYTEYIDTKKRKNIFLAASRMIKQAKVQKETFLSENQVKFDLQKKKIETNYNEFRHGVYEKLKRSTNVKVK